jgi:hypothetical protein
MAVFDTADAEAITTVAAAERLAERRIADISHVQLIRPPTPR